MDSTASGSAPTARCPSCGAQASGRFCSECGATLGQSRCPACSAEMLDGARFCHRCGLAAGAAVPPGAPKPGSAMSLPWIVAAIALLAFIALVAGQRFGATPQAQQQQVAGPPADGAAAPPMGGGRAPDISQMSPTERAIRLHDRIMTYHEAGKQDSIAVFAPMAIAAYEMLGNLDIDSRYDLGRIGEVSGDAKLAAAQADTILQSNPTHLLGLILAARAARMENRAADERRFYERLIAAEPTERPRKTDEYTVHQNDIVAALDEARRAVRR